VAKQKELVGGMLDRLGNIYMYDGERVETLCLSLLEKKLMTDIWEMSIG